MSGLLWTSLGAALGLGVLLLYRLWQRSVADADTLPGPRETPRGRSTAQPSARPALKAPKAPAGLNRKQTRKFHGVSVKPCLDACKAAQELAGQRFLPDEAPAMPLAGCDQQRCQCAYSHHGDRRDREDRRSGWGTFGGFTPSIPGGNRRAKSQNRRSDPK